MFDKVLVGIDGRQGGRDATALAQRLAPAGGRITLAHVYGGPTAGGRAAALARPLALESAERLLKRAARECDLPVDTATVCESSVGRGLHALAERRRAELLVVGSCHRGMLGRVLLGDDTARSLNGAPCAVAVAPHGYAASAPQRLARIGVGWDGSPESALAVHVARGLAARHESTISALAVVSLRGVPIPGWWPKIASQLVDEEQNRLAELEGVDGVVTYGDPGAELAAFSAELDLLIVGSRGYGPVGRLFHGSVSSYLVGHARCPLLVLPRGSLRESRPDANGHEVQAMFAGAA